MIDKTKQQQIDDDGDDDENQKTNSKGLNAHVHVLCNNVK